MYVTVSLTIEIDASASLSDMERQIQQAGREGMKEALKQALCQSAEQAKTCPACGSERVQTQGTKRRVLLTRFGRVDVPLRRLRCQQCCRLFRPAARCLAEVQGYNITPDLRELAALVGSSWPYETAARVLAQLSGVQISAERLRQLTNEQGSRLSEQHQSQAQQVLQEAISMPQIRAQRAQSQLQGKQDHPQWLQVGLDGGWLRSREQKGGMEGKIGVVASHMEPVGKHGRHRLATRRYVATFGPAEEVGKLAYAAACQRERDGGSASSSPGRWRRLDQDASERALSRRAEDLGLAPFVAQNPGRRACPPAWQTLGAQSLAQSAV